MSEGALLELRERTKTKNDELKRASRVLEFLLEGENGGRERTADARVGILGGRSQPLVWESAYLSRGMLLDDGDPNRSRILTSTRVLKFEPGFC